MNVNPKASTCEGFLKGYCADGNEVLSYHTHFFACVCFFFNFFYAGLNPEVWDSFFLLVRSPIF